LPAFVEPSLALLADKPPNGPQWVHEIKFDGYRIQARIDAGQVRLLTRKALDWANRFPTIAAAVEALEVHTALLDGEIVSEDERGIGNPRVATTTLRRCKGDDPWSPRRRSMSSSRASTSRCIGILRGASNTRAVATSSKGWLMEGLLKPKLR
jgi:ATP dependent DNA ligase domain